MTKQTAEDRDILRTYGHPDGPRYNGPRRVECRNYDEHRWAFRRVAGRWICDECREEQGR